MQSFLLISKNSLTLQTNVQIHEYTYTEIQTFEGEKNKLAILMLMITNEHKESLSGYKEKLHQKRKTQPNSETQKFKMEVQIRKKNK